MSARDATREVKSPREIALEFDDLRARLDEAEQTLGAIRSGGVDALVVYTEEGERVFTLKGADEPYRIFVEEMKEGAVTLADDGTILYCNRSFATMIDMPLERAIGASIDGILFGTGGEAFTQVARGVQPPATLEMAVVRADRQVPVMVSLFRLLPNASASIALTVADLTQAREQSNQLIKLNAELEGFSYSVAHDLRAPLRSIVSAANVVIEDYAPNLPDEAFSDLRRIADSATRLGRLIDDLLTYSSLSSQPLRIATVSVTGLAHEIARLEAAESDRHIELKIQSGLVVRGDETLLRLVFQNLISNAVKYTRNVQNPIIEIGIEQSPRQVAFFVRDNGIGFDTAYVDRIFLPFERLHRPSEYPGTGIGLASAKRIISRHGGRIWADSQPGQGATFFFTLTNGN